MNISEVRRAPWLPMCTKCEKAQMVYQDEDEEFVSLIGGKIKYGEGGWECPVCGFKLNSDHLPEPHLEDDGYWAAYFTQAEKTLWKNYPPDKYEYISKEELLNKYPNIFNRDNLECFNKLMYCIHIDGKLWFLAKSVEVHMSEKFLYSLFNIALPEDLPADYKVDDTEELLKYLHPNDTKYLSEQEAIERVKRNSPYWFDKKHMDFFTHNMIYQGKRIYLRSSIQDYTDLYDGLLYPLSDHAYFHEYNPNEYEQD